MCVRASCSVCSLSCKFQMHKSNATHLIFTISLCFTSGCSRAYAGAGQRLGRRPLKLKHISLSLSFLLICAEALLLSLCLCVCECVCMLASVSYACYNGWLGTPVRFPPPTLLVHSQSQSACFVSLYAQLHTAHSTSDTHTLTHTCAYIYIYACHSRAKTKLPAGSLVALWVK